MHPARNCRPFAAALAVTLLLGATGASAQDGDRYQIVKATENRVWRLDRQTGEVAVCSLTGDRLVCTTSSDAASPPKQDYEQLNAERRQAEQDEQQRQLALLDRLLAMFREFVRFAMGGGNGNEGGGG
ncbi:MAG: hypothetical protein WD270_05660 [Acetobacterales bacterium]